MNLKNGGLEASHTSSQIGLSGLLQLESYVKFKVKAGSGVRTSTPRVFVTQLPAECGDLTSYTSHIVHTVLERTGPLEQPVEAH